MKIEITELAPCQLLVHCEANFVEIGNKKEEVLNHFKKAPVKGFRPGHASVEAIKMHYGKQIEESTKRALAEDSYHEALFQHKLRPHGAPKFNSLLLDGGKFVTEFEMYTKPDFDLVDWKALEIPKPHEEETTEEVGAKMMQELRERLGDTIPYGETDFVQTGDNVIVSYDGFVDGQKVDNLSAKDEMMTVGKGPIQGFDTNFLGMLMNETREFDFVAPETGLPSLSGKTIHFVVTLITGAKNTPCALDDEMAKKMGKNTFQELQEFIGQAAFGRVASFNRTKLQEAVSRRLVSETKVAVPVWMSVSEAQYLAQQSQLDWNAMADADRERFVQMAEQNVTLSLVLDGIREVTPEAQLTDQEVFESIKKNLANTKVKASIDEVIQQMNKTGYLQILFSRIRDEHTMDYILRNIKIVD